MNLQAQWIVGFVDGEGCFHVSIVSNKTLSNGYQVMPEFVVTQHERDIQLLYGLKSFFGCGIVKKNGQNCYSYYVRNYKHLHEKIIPFFEKHKLKTKKRVDFEKFRYIVNSMMEGKHLTLEGLKDLHAFLKQWRRVNNNNNQGQEQVHPLDLTI